MTNTLKLALTAAGSGGTIRSFREYFGREILTDRRLSFELAVLLFAIVAFADYSTRFEVRLAVFYLVPLFLATWSAGWAGGMLLAVLATVAWFFSFRSTHIYAQDIYYYWEDAILFITLTTFVLILARLRRALSLSDERFVTVLEGMNEAVYVFEPESGRILYANQCFKDLFRRNDAEPRNVRELGGAGASEELALNAPLTAEREFQDQGKQRWFRVRSSAIRWTDGGAVRLNVASDITEAKESEATRRKQLERLEMSARLVTIGELTSSLAHELNQPLTAIVGYCQGCTLLLRAGNTDFEALMGYMDKCSAQAVRASGIVNSMRDLVRKRGPDRSRQDLNALIKETTQLMRAEIDASGAELSMKLAADLPPALVDGVMIGQVLLNLVKNALDAMQQVEPGERRLLITSSFDGAMARVAVVDSGPGLSQEAQAHLFMPFFSTKPNGLGIGLNICRTLVEKHGGELRHESGMGGGAAFCFTVALDVP